MCESERGKTPFASKKGGGIGSNFEIRGAYFED